MGILQRLSSESSTHSRPASVLQAAANAMMGPNNMVVAAATRRSGFLGTQAASHRAPDDMSCEWPADKRQKSDDGVGQADGSGGLKKKRTLS